MTYRTLCAASVLAVLSFGAGSALASEEAQPAPRVGDQTRQWLDLQQSGSAASTVERPMPGEVAAKVTKRYQDSFAYPIPEEFKREGFKTGGGS